LKFVLTSLQELHAGFTRDTGQSGIALRVAAPGLEPQAAEGNQDSPDPEGPLKPAEFQQLATIYASSCHPVLEFAGFRVVLCRTLLTQMFEFARLTDDHYQARARAR
jgi:hypothetical protein